MGVCKKCALLDTDFLYKTQQARNNDHHTLADFVLDFEDYDFYDLREPDKLYAYIKNKLDSEKQNYIFLDEIQHV